MNLCGGGSKNIKLWKAFFDFGEKGGVVGKVINRIVVATLEEDHTSTIVVVFLKTLFDVFKFICPSIWAFCVGPIVTESAVFSTDVGVI